MVFDSDFLKIYAELSAINDSDTERRLILKEGKKSKKPANIASVKRDYSKEMDEFLRNIGLVRLSEIAPKCQNFSPTGTAVWVPSGNYEEDLPHYKQLAEKHLPKFVAELPSDDYPLPKWSPKPVQNNGDRKVYTVDLGAVGSNQWRGAWFRFKIQDAAYFIFGHIFYKNYQKINASTNRDIAIVNTFYDKVIPKSKEYKIK